MKISPIFKTTILFSILTVLFVTVGYILNGVSGAVFFLGFSAITSFFTYWFSDRIVLTMSGARVLNEAELPQFFADVKVLAQKMNIPMPRLYTTEDLQPNAFATGRTPAVSVVCVTQGLLKLLSADEVKAVIAHELSHIKNRDVLVASVAAVIAGAITTVTQIGFLFNGGRDEQNRNPVAEILFFIFAPLAAVLIQLAISRSREFLADATAAEAMGSGKLLAEALIKIESTSKEYPVPNVNHALASLYIENPFRNVGIMGLFSTHPPVAERVKRLVS